MFKNVIAPVQAWLLSQGRCVGCGSQLSPDAPNSKSGKNDGKVICKKCGRIFVYDSKTRKHRRALFNEV